MLPRLTILPLLFLVPTRLYSQTECAGITFSDTKEFSLASGGGTTVLARQPDGSYSAVVVTDTSGLKFGSLYSDYQNAVLAGCVGAATLTTTLPTIPDNPPPLGVASQGAAMADFQHSGIPSVVYAGFGDPATKITVASLAAFPTVNTTTIAVASPVATVLTGDFNNDGKYDFAAVEVGDETSQNPGGVQIFLGNGDGTFKTGETYLTGANALHATAADLNNDGKLDLVVCGDGTSAISVLLGNGDGTFHATAATPMAGQGPVSVVAADFNNDKKLDLAVSNEDGTVSIFLGNGDGSFQNAIGASCGLDCAYLAAGDFNKDGKLDLALTNLDDNVVSILMGKGDGTFGAPSFYSTDDFPLSIVLADFNNDGNLDVLIATGTPDYLAKDPSTGNIDVMLGNGDGTFQGTHLVPAGQGATALVTTDLNGDGKPDVVVAAKGSQDLHVFLGQGGGEFQALAPYSFNFTNSGGPVYVVSADFNKDEKMDVATVAEYAQTVAISLGNGDGTFQSPTMLAAGTTPVAAAAGDLNGDGKPDLVVADNGSQDVGSTDSGAVLVYLSTGSGFQPVKRFTAGSHPSSVVIQDVNLDGKPDLIVSDAGQLGVNDTGGMSILLGNGDGTFRAGSSYLGGVQRAFNRGGGFEWRWETGSGFTRYQRQFQ